MAEGAVAAARGPTRPAGGAIELALQALPAHDSASQRLADALAESTGREQESGRVGVLVPRRPAEAPPPSRRGRPPLSELAAAEGRCPAESRAEPPRPSRSWAGPRPVEDRWKEQEILRMRMGAELLAAEKELERLEQAEVRAAKAEGEVKRLLKRWETLAKSQTKREKDLERQLEERKAALRSLEGVILQAEREAKLREKQPEGTAKGVAAVAVRPAFERSFSAAAEIASGFLGTLRPDVKRPVPPRGTSPTPSSSSRPASRSASRCTALQQLLTPARLQAGGAAGEGLGGALLRSIRAALVVAEAEAEGCVKVPSQSLHSSSQTNDWPCIGHLGKFSLALAELEAASCLELPAAARQPFALVAERGPTPLALDATRLPSPGTAEVPSNDEGRGSSRAQQMPPEDAAVLSEHLPNAVVTNPGDPRLPSSSCCGLLRHDVLEDACSAVEAMATVALSPQELSERLASKLASERRCLVREMRRIQERRQQVHTHCFSLYETLEQTAVPVRHLQRERAALLPSFERAVEQAIGLGAIAAHMHSMPRRGDRKNKVAATSSTRTAIGGSALDKSSPHRIARADRARAPSASEDGGELVDVHGLRDWLADVKAHQVAATAAEDPWPTLIYRLGHRLHVAKEENCNLRVAAAKAKIPGARVIHAPEEARALAAVQREARGFAERCSELTAVGLEQVGAWAAWVARAEEQLLLAVAARRSDDSLSAPPADPAAVLLPALPPVAAAAARLRELLLELSRAPSSTGAGVAGRALQPCLAEPLS